jgi:hypothetical protein
MAPDEYPRIARLTSRIAPILSDRTCGDVSLGFLTGRIGINGRQ